MYNQKLTIKEKKCPRCLEVKPISSFNKGANRRTDKCTECLNEINVERAHQFSQQLRKGGNVADKKQFNREVMSIHLRTLVQERIWWEHLFSYIAPTTKLSAKYLSEQLRLIDSEIHEIVNELAWKGETPVQTPQENK